MAFDTTRLVSQITLKGCLPTGRFTPAEIMDLAYDVLLSEIVPDIIDLREEYYGRSSDATLITANQAAYPIISRSYSGLLREVKMVVANTITDLVRIDPEDLTEIRYGTPENFYLQGNDIILDPIPNTTQGSLRQLFFMRPSRLVSAAECGRITAVDPNTNTITASTPSDWATTDTFDLIKGRGGFDILSFDLAADSVSTSQIQFSSSLPSTLVPGDYVTKAEETLYPFLPIEGHVALIQATAAAAQRAIGMPQAAETGAVAEMLKKNFKTVLSVRVQGAPKTLGVRVL